MGEQALVTDVKVVGDAALLRLNSSKPPLHYFDYFVKLEWEVASCGLGVAPYRPAAELIRAAAETQDVKVWPMAQRSNGRTFQLSKCPSCPQHRIGVVRWTLDHEGPAVDLRSVSLLGFLQN